MPNPTTAANSEASEKQEFYAHTALRLDGTRDLDQSRWQLLRDHLRAVAAKAKEFAAPFGSEVEAEVAGLLHDLGKYARRFQERLRNPRIHGINHWSAGAAASYKRRALRAAFAIEGHHTGMPALLENDVESGLECLQQRIQKLQDSAMATEVCGFNETDAQLLADFAADRLPVPKEMGSEDLPQQDFATALRTRMLFSCLVDADFLDTEKHFDGATAALRESPHLDTSRALEQLLAVLNAKPSEGEVNRLRRELLRDCLAAAEKPRGLFTLTAPTGSGKTLASLAFALRHIEHHNELLAADDPKRLRRIIVVIPYTTIIEQTAQVFRDLFEPAFGPHYVLEHHSASTLRPENGDGDAENERVRRARMAVENWDAPVVVTTSVQFFESLFAHRPSKCRKLHNIGGSVVIFDEVQTLPVRLVPSLLSTVNLLARDYGVTAVFGTATQPAFASAASAVVGGWMPTEISSRPRAMAEGFRRTRIIRRAETDRPTWPELADELASHERVLCVVNLKRHARELFTALPSSDRFHLSAAMCPAHRQVRLAEIRRRLDGGKPCRLISTQLIEAGVDIDFPRVYRALGPLDSIIQTAGRCNREGHLPQPGEVIVFRPADDGMPRGAYKQAGAVTEAFLAENLEADLHLPETYAAYFARLYRTLGPQSKKADPAFVASEKLHFPEAARACQLVGDNTRAVVVRWDEGERIIDLVRLQKHLSRDDWRRALRFSVSFYELQFLAALARGDIVQPVKDLDFYYWNGHYDEEIGVTSLLPDELIV